MVADPTPSIRSTDTASSLHGADDWVRARALYSWELWARPDQLAPPGDWRTWLCLSARGWGKTRTGIEWTRGLIESGAAGRVALVAATSSDCRDVLTEGESGMLRCCPPWNRPEYEPSKRRLTWNNGATATLFSAEEPDRLRGPQFDAAYVDELAAWPHLNSAGNAWDMLQFAVRLGSDPKVLVTTTPRPIRIVRAFFNDPTCVITRGTTLDNAANLAPQFVEQITARYKGTRLYKQEILGHILEDIEDAILTSELVASLRVAEATDIERVVVGVDPAVTAGDNSDKTGIVVAGRGANGHLYAIEDLSCRLGPAGWARRAVDAYRRHQAECIIVERNQGGLMCEHTLRTIDSNLPIRLVNATKGKTVRAQPILTLFELRRAHTVDGLDDLEAQLVAFTPGGYDGDRSPDNADAFIWAATYLMDEPAFVGLIK